MTPPPIPPGARSPIPSGELETEFGIAQLVEVVARRWTMLAAIALAVTIVTVAATFLMTPRYDAVAQIKIDPRAKQVTDATVAPTSPQADQSRIDTEVEILKSRQIAGQVVEKLGLAADAEFRPEGEAAARASDSARGQVIDTFAERLKVTRESDNYIVNVSFSSRSPSKAAEIANAVSDAYVQSSVAERTRTAGGQAAFLTQRLATLGAQIQASEAEIARYRARAGIVEGTTQGTVTDQQVGPLSSQLAQSDSEAAVANADLTAARALIARGNISAVSSVLNSPVIADLRRQRAETTQEQAQVEARYGPKHPEYARVTEKLRDIDGALSDEAQRIVAGLESKARSASASAGSVRSSLNQIRGQQAANTRSAVVADSLDRQVKAKQASYDQLAQALQQVTQEQRNQEPTAVIVERAVAPVDPSSPNRPLFAALGAVLGLILGFAAILIIEFLANTVQNADDLPRSLGIPFITSIPQLSARQLRTDGGKITPRDFIAHKQMSSFAEAFRTIRSSIVLNQASHPKVIAILSSLPREGKSTVSVALARAMALSGDRVVLVDCDLRRGEVQDIVVQNPGGGLIEVLTGEITAADAIVKDGLTSLDVLPLQSRSFTAVDLFSGDRMRALLDELRSSYDFVVLDTAPVLAVADSRIIASLADTSIFVTRAGVTPRRAARAALDLIAQDGSAILGGILSAVAPGGRRLSTNDPSYYYSKYRSYQEA